MTLTQDTANPLTTSITSSLKVAVPSGTTGQVGFTNAGYSGVPINDDTYACYFWMKGIYDGGMTVSLVDSDGNVYGSVVISVNTNDNSFSYFPTSFASTQAPTGDNFFQLTFDAASVAGSELWFALPQLFPVTFHERQVQSLAISFLASSN